MDQSIFPSSARPARRPRRTLRVLAWVAIFIIVIALLASFGVSYVVGWTLTHPKPSPIEKTPSDIGLQFENIVFPSRVDHLQLHGWLVKADAQTDKAVVLAHGYNGNRSKDEPALPTMKALHDAGFNVIAFDFRDEGESPGKQVSVGAFEVRDLMGAVDYAKSHGNNKVGVIGFSMGASTALSAAVEDKQIDAVIADSPFANLHDYLAQNMPVWTHLPNWPFTQEILWEMRVFSGLDAKSVDPLDGLRNYGQRPLTLIAGTADTTIPMSNSQALFNVVKSNPADSLWIVDGAKHVGAYKVAPTVYEHKVTQFFTLALGS